MFQLKIYFYIDGQAIKQLKVPLWGSKVDEFVSISCGLAAKLMKNHRQLN
jgi:hypothetical protein